MKKLLTTDRCDDSCRTAFTLVELLLVITIIAIIASLGVGVMAQAQDDASAAATRSRMALIQKILEIELEDYEVRRSPVSFGNLVELIQLPSTSLTDKTGRTLLHVKNLKRMFMADLIRAEIPDGSITGDNPGVFPSTVLLEYLDRELGIPPATARNAVPLPLTGMSSFGLPPADININDGVLDDATYRSELLYQNLLNIDSDGVPATDILGTRAIGDTDGNGRLEILDGWGEPMFLEWQQERLQIDDNEDNVWSSVGGVFCGLSCEHASFQTQPNFRLGAYCQPVLPTQIRPHLTSERIQNIDGASPADYAPRAGQP